MNLLIRYWYHSSWLCYLLFPLSAIFRWIVSIRRFCYRRGIIRSTKFSVPVIVVGNVTVGGNGKTPFVIWLVEFLKKHGYKPGVVSRGYGGRASHYPQLVMLDSDPKIVGDEAILLKCRTECPVVVAPDRVSAVQHLLQDYDCNIVIADDGLQHYRLQRDIEIVVIDGKRGFGNGFCLPAGPLREPVSRLAEVDFQVVTNGPVTEGQFIMALQPKTLINLQRPQDTRLPEDFNQQPVHAVAGIGNPERFFETLRQLNFQVIEHPFPDHHLFKPEDFLFAGDGSIVIMTEKDAVKCWAFAKPNYWYLPVTAEVDETLGRSLLEKLVATVH